MQQSTENISFLFNYSENYAKIIQKNKISISIAKHMRLHASVLSQTQLSSLYLVVNIYSSNAGAIFFPFLRTCDITIRKSLENHLHKNGKRIGAGRISIVAEPDRNQLQSLHYPLQVSLR